MATVVEERAVPANLTLNVGGSGYVSPSRMTVSKDFVQRANEEDDRWAWRYVRPPASARKRDIVHMPTSTPDTRSMGATRARNLPRVAGRVARPLQLRRAFGDDVPAPTALGAEVDDPVGRLDHVEVVLDDEDGVALVDEARSTSSSLRTSSKCRPVVGSSRR